MINRLIFLIIPIFCLFGQLCAESYGMEDSVNNAVVIRTWNHGDYGHASLEFVDPNTKQTVYVSFWAQDDKEAKINKDKEDKVKNSTYELDQKILKGPENTAHTIKVPNINALSGEWKKLSEAELTFSLFERSKNTFNCSSIVKHLVDKGGLDLEMYLDLVNIHNPITQGLILSLALGKDMFNVIYNDMKTLMYPGKISYMAQKAMMAQMKRRFETGEFSQNLRKKITPVNNELKQTECDEIVKYINGTHFQLTIKPGDQNKNDENIFKALSILKLASNNGIQQGRNN